MKRLSLLLAGALLLLLCTPEIDHAEETRLRPYLLTWQGAEALEKRVTATRLALQGAGFEIAGEYAVSSAAHVFVVTSASLKQAAAGSPYGGYGAALRVAVTQVGGQVQVSSTNPAWMAAAYRLRGDLADAAAAIERALGKGQPFGSADGLAEKELRSYHYMVAMPYFTDQVLLAEFPDHGAALERVSRGLAGSAAVRLIARVDVPGTEETLFSVAVLRGEGADAAVLQITDTGALRHTAYAPYEVLVSGKKALMLHGKFRIAQSFPDLGMGTFMKISGAPGGIEQELRAAVK
jgi:hypothetical protein